LLHCSFGDKLSDGGRKVAGCANNIIAWLFSAADSGWQSSTYLYHLHILTLPAHWRKVSKDWSNFQVPQTKLHCFCQCTWLNIMLLLQAFWSHKACDINMTWHHIE
jgi:hypothetical protein